MTASPETSSAARAGTVGLPDFFIVGHPKCGTTALYEMLRSHPEIHMPVKEPWFFEPARVGDRSRPALEDYVALFAGAAPGQRIGEATPSYLRSRTAAERIAEVQPGARIIAILREPASFLRSFHLQSVQAHVETETDFARALELESARREGRELPRECPRPEALMYSDHVRYVEQLSRYRSAFGAEQMLTLVYDDFRSDNEATVRRVQRFLGVDASRPLELVDANPSVRVRSPSAREVVRSLSLGRGAPARAARAAVKAATPQRMRRRTIAAVERRLVYGEPQQPDEQLTLELRRRFRGQVVSLSAYLDRDLVTLWGYDGIA